MHTYYSYSYIKFVSIYMYIQVHYLCLCLKGYNILCLGGYITCIRSNHHLCFFYLPTELFFSSVNGLHLSMKLMQTPMK